MLSMTAFASISEKTALGVINCEMKSVNHRYLELGFRLSEPVREFEPMIRQLVRGELNRGKVDISLGLKFDPAILSLQVNTDMAKQVLAACRELETFAEQTTHINLMDVLSQPGVLDKADVPSQELKVCVEKIVLATLEKLIANRASEGGHLQDVLASRCQQIKDIVPKLRDLQQENKSLQQARLRKRLDEFQIELDDGRFEQEVVIGLQKSDISEEIDRLAAHVSELERLLVIKEPVGRRLDFLMQEFNREANTIASKSIQVEMTQLALDVKVLVEQLREQVQNIE